MPVLTIEISYWLFRFAEKFLINRPLKSYTLMFVVLLFVGVITWKKLCVGLGIILRDWISFWEMPISMGGACVPEKKLKPPAKFPISISGRLSLFKSLIATAVLIPSLMG